ncbi:Thymidylate kinase [Methanimicrococcus stummii]|uniref:Probable thymidylate kinase n=1 Tax=Methanimicrococcus stummii TaxID=3028294 RepID=A0AA96V859_9EURY|nr:dTMP kinase [Methanimicrococcus sp. Es2]WNY27988.1 Thymidylate kinase [Methanimicrococcus sp. Es2]
MKNKINEKDNIVSIAKNVLMIGKLVTFEGIDGSGKSTMLARLQKLNESAPLNKETENTIFTREPTKETLTGNAVYAAIENNVDPLAELFLFLADHAAHLSDTIRPALNENKLIISDRYSDSRCAYQGATLKDTVPNAFDFVRRLHEPWTVKPDLTFFFDIRPEVSCERCKDRGAQTKFERVDFLKEVRENFKKLAADEPSRFVILDAEKPPEENEKIVLEKIRSL